MTRQQIVEALHAGANALEAWARAQKVQPAEAVAILRHLRDAIERGQEASAIFVKNTGEYIDIGDREHLALQWSHDDGVTLRPVLILSLNEEGRG